MVIMNAVDDKENKDRLNGTSSCVTPGDTSVSTESTREKTTKPVQVKLNGNSPQKNDSNKYPITNGAFTRANSAFSSVSTTRDTGSAQALCSRSGTVPREGCCGGSGQDLYLKNSNESYSDGDHRKEQMKAGERASRDDSSSEDEECCCIYTYKGDSNQMADLPSSFFRMDYMPSRLNAASRNSSPDMDYLEMDFDPGPSNDRFSSSESECDDNPAQFVCDLPLLPNPVPDLGAISEVAMDPSPTPLSPLSTPSPVLSPRPVSALDQPSTSEFIDTPWFAPPSTPEPLQNSRVDADNPMETTYCYCIANKTSPMSIDENFNEGEVGVMIWKEQEAKEKQVNQIGTSMCGATAVMNTLLGLNVPFTVSAVKQHVGTRLRANSAEVPEYLMSRCDAGVTHEDMIRALDIVSQGQVFARFFHMYPQRSISLANWLSYWIRKGAVPIATLNLQQSPNARLNPEFPDSWHHQMIYGVKHQDVFLTNPLESQSEENLIPQLTSPSELLVRTQDVISRWTPDTSLHPLIHPSKPLWRKMNVLGQVVSVIRDNGSSQGPSGHCPLHIRIPASYSGGVTLAVLKNSPAHQQLLQAPELPVDPFASS